MLLLLLLFGSPQWGWCIKSFCKICPWTWRRSSLPLFTETNWKQKLLPIWGTLLSLDANFSLRSSASPLRASAWLVCLLSQLCAPCTAGDSWQWLWGEDDSNKVESEWMHNANCILWSNKTAPGQNKHNIHTCKILESVGLEVGGSLSHYFLRRTSICRIF